MLDLTGPARPWPQALVDRFGDAHRRALDEADCWGTPPPQGDPRLLAQLSDMFGAPVGRTVVIGGVRQFAGSWAGRTRIALVEQPGFAEIGPILGGAADVQAMPWERLPEAARRQSEHVTVWVTSPQRNPDGRSLDGAERASLAELASEGHHVIVNQVYRWFAPLEPLPSGCWGVTSLAKLCGGGSRLGWATLPDEDTVLPMLRGSGPATLWQRAWADFLSPRTFESLHRACVEPTLEARRIFTDRMGELLGWELPAGGMSLVLVWDGMTEKRVLAEFEAQGLRVGPGSAFGAEPGSIRLAFSGVDASEAAQAADRVARLASRAAGALAPCGSRSPQRPGSSRG